MKLFSIFAVIAAAVTVVCASNVETNAARFARGLPPLPPRNLYTPVAGLLSDAFQYYSMVQHIPQPPSEAIPLDTQCAPLARLNAAPPSSWQATPLHPLSSNF
jgi:hypothetical protein